MKKLLLIAGIVLLIACVLCLSAGVLHLSVYRHAQDGSAEFYSRTHRRMVVFFAVGAVLAAAGAFCIIRYLKF